MKRINVTQAGRHFSDIVNRVCYQGVIVELERENKVIARITPASPNPPLQVKDLNGLFAELPLLDKEDANTFKKDLADIRKQIPMEQNQWD